MDFIKPGGIRSRRQENPESELIKNDQAKDFNGSLITLCPIFPSKARTIRPWLPLFA
jgi:hypothetical protein